MTRPVFLPRTLDELWETLDRAPGAAVYAGGTDLLVRLRSGRSDPPALICLERIEALRRVEDRGDRLYLGAGAAHARLLEHPAVRRRLPVLAQALAVLGSPPVRNMGTLGGNLATASPAGDCLPPLYVLGAEVDLVSRGSSRRMKVSDFILGPGRTALSPGEIIAGVSVPQADGFNVRHFEKVGQRNALAIAVVSLAALVRLDKDGRAAEARLAWGSVGPTVVVSPEAEAALVGNRLDRETLERAANLARKAVAPIDDVRASADYRRQVAGNLLLRLADA